MESVITGLVSRFGYWGVLLLIAVENIFPPIPSEVILTFGGFLTTCTEMTPPGVILFSTLGSVAGAIVLYGVGRLLAPQRLEALLSGRALEIAQELGVVEVALSITLTGDLAVANAIAITEDARPKPKEEKVSTKKRVAQTFKEARSVLDELEQLQNSALTEHLGDASQDTLGA